MQAANILVLGQTGSGKTTFVKLFLLPYAPRYLILDKFQDYTDYGEVFYTFSDCVDYIYKYLDHDFRVVFQGDKDLEYHALLHWILTAQKEYILPPLTLVMEEASEYTSSHQITEEISRLYRYARRWGVFNIAISQRDVLVNPIVRDNSQVIVSFKQNKVSEDYRKYFGERLNSITLLEPLSQPWVPVRDVHYITHPENIDATDILWKGIASWSPGTYDSLE